MVMSSHRYYSITDKLLMHLDHGLKTVFIKPESTRAYPAQSENSTDLDASEQKHSEGLMRVNHTGEVCAQALYHAQALTGRTETIKQKMRQAALEEDEHLNWCQTRLEELNGRTSFLNPMWYAGSFAIGATAGVLGDKWNLGFLQATEEQVVQHLGHHLKQLPERDTRSRAIIEQMKEDEQEHADMARASGAAILPKPVQSLMKATSKVMTTISYHV